MASTQPSIATRSSRPVLADRDCSHVNLGTSSSRAPSYAATARSGRTTSHNNLPRPRSFHNTRPLSAHAQAAQDGYYARKAAKAIAEKRKAVAASVVTNVPTSDSTTVVTNSTHHISSGSNTPSASNNPVLLTTNPVTPPVTQTTNSPVQPAVPVGTNNDNPSSNPATDLSLQQRASVPVINVTVDAAGVRIRDGPSGSTNASMSVAQGSTQGGNANGGGSNIRPTRRASHARLSRSLSRTRVDNRVRLSETDSNKSGRNASTRARVIVDDKENVSSMGNEMFAGRRRLSKRDIHRKDGSVPPVGVIGGNANGAVMSHGESSWDGSMPRRQSSRGFIERNARVENRAERTPVEQADAPEGLQRSLSRQGVARADEEPVLRKGWNTKRMMDGDDIVPTNDVAEFKRKESQMAVSSDFAKLEIACRDEVKVDIAPGATVDVMAGASSGEDTKCTTAKTEMVGKTEESKTVYSVATSQPAVTVMESKSTKVVESDTSKQPSSESSQNSETSEAASTSTTDSQKMPLCGKWCEHCAGLGMTIAALVAELERTQPPPHEGMKRVSSSTSTAKKGWRSVVSQTVLGDSKSSKTAKTSKTSECARLEQENSVLRATVDFLYKKMEHLERGVSKNEQ